MLGVKAKRFMWTIHVPATQSMLVLGQIFGEDTVTLRLPMVVHIIIIQDIILDVKGTKKMHVRIQHLRRIRRVLHMWQMLLQDLCSRETRVVNLVFRMDVQELLLRMEQLVPCLKNLEEIVGVPSLVMGGNVMGGTRQMDVNMLYILVLVAVCTVAAVAQASRDVLMVHGMVKQCGRILRFQTYPRGITSGICLC